LFVQQGFHLPKYGFGGDVACLQPVLQSLLTNVVQHGAQGLPEPGPSHHFFEAYRCIGLEQTVCRGTGRRTRRSIHALACVSCHKNGLPLARVYPASPMSMSSIRLARSSATASTPSTFS